MSNEFFDIPDDGNEDNKSSKTVLEANRILLDAISKKAGTVHIEPYNDKSRIRYRINGELQEAGSNPIEDHNGLIARLKIICLFDIAERRIPQFGEFSFKHKNSTVHFSAMTVPGPHHESIILRRIVESDFDGTLDSLGLDPLNYSLVDQAIHKKSGLILITGPAYSGRRTTALGILTKLNTPNKKIIAMDNMPRDYPNGVQQIFLNKNVNFQNIDAMRFIHHYDCDVVYAGSLFNREAAEGALCTASEHGKLVIGVTGFLDLVTCINSLMQFDIEPWRIATAMNLVQSQRLLRKLCESCKQPISKSTSVANAGLTMEQLQNANLFQATGCEACSNTGYHGHILICETLVITEEIANEMLARFGKGNELSSHIIRRMAQIKMLSESAIDHMCRGETTPQEVAVITS